MYITMPPAEQLRIFQQTVWDYYHAHKRDLPWRTPLHGALDPYHILVSEIMLQQTQVSRVVPKYRQFLALFPNIESLAAAELAEVLAAWSGLGYNRRAKFLHQTAKVVTERLNGLIPQDSAELVQLPGIGINTAGAILAYSFNQPVTFIETNIRSVYLHHFFTDQSDIADKILLPLVEATLDTSNPREWYWALMDYGTFLKATIENPSIRSRHYSRQTKFEGSKRQIRGRVIKQLLQAPASQAELQLHITDERLAEVLQDLQQEQMITYIQGIYSLRK